MVSLQASQRLQIETVIQPRCYKFSLVQSFPWSNRHTRNGLGGRITGSKSSYPIRSGIQRIESLKGNFWLTPTAKGVQSSSQVIVTIFLMIPWMMEDTSCTLSMGEWSIPFQEASLDVILPAIGSMWDFLGFPLNIGTPR